MQARIGTAKIRIGRLESLVAVVLAILVALFALVWQNTANAQAQEGQMLYLPLVPGSQAAPTDQAAIIPNQYIVVLQGISAQGASPAATSAADAAMALTARYGGEIIYTYEATLRGFAARLSSEQAAAMGADPAVALIEPDQLMQINEIDVTQAGATWGLDRVDQRDLPLNTSYVYNNGGAGVHVYIIDTGIRATHSEFSGRMGNGYTAISDEYGTSDCNGHGTHVAGTVGGTLYGIAKEATLHAVRVLNCSGSGSTAGVIAGIEWVTLNHQKPAVANMSLGGGTSFALDNALRASVAAGVSYAVAAGNDSLDACNYSPARVAEALTVGATTSADARSSFSNYGSCLGLFAPGSGITSASISGDTASINFSGTSMASPHVAGAIALYLAANPNAAPSQVATAIRDNATLNKVTSAGTDSPNRLLYTLATGAQENTPTPTLTPTPTATDVIPDENTPTPTLTPSPTATATVTPIPTATAVPELCDEIVVNGSLEAGNTPWLQSSTQGFLLLCSAATCGTGLEPHSGSTLAWLGGSNRERSRLSQNITIPSGKKATLTYWYLIQSQDYCSYDRAYVQIKFGNTIRNLRTTNLCASANTPGWVQSTLDLSSYAGRSLRLDFYVVTDGYNVSSFFVDDISLLSGNTCTAASAAGGVEALSLETIPLDEEFVEMPLPERTPEPPVGPIEHQR